MPNAGTITSAANPLLKDVRRAIARGGLTEQGCWVAETFHLLEEALRSDCRLVTVLAAESVRSSAEAMVRHVAGVKVVAVPDALMQRLSDTETSPGVMALVEPPTWSLDQLIGERGAGGTACPTCPLVVVLDGVQDPGNAGTIVRAAEAFGATGVLFLKGTVSPFNPKTLRASAGSLFRVPFIAGVDPVLTCAALQQRRVELFAGVPARSRGSVRSIAEVDLTGGCALVIGNEARGVGAELRAAASDVSIPTAGVESLNAAVAAGILLYETRRQRTQRA